MDVKIPSQVPWVVAVPGVGNVGKLVIDGLLEEHESRLAVALVHPDLPPHAVSHVSGDLQAPALRAHLLNLGGPLVLATSPSQPMTPNGQHDLAMRFRSLAIECSASFLVVLVGRLAEPGVTDVEIQGPVATDREWLESRGAGQSVQWPEGGMIGMAAWLASGSEFDALSTACISAASVGASADPEAAERMRCGLEEFLKRDLPTSGSTHRDLARRVSDLLGALDAFEIEGDGSPQVDLYQ